jgi:hypothetical protein
LRLMCVLTLFLQALTSHIAFVLRSATQVTVPVSPANMTAPQLSCHINVFFPASEGYHNVDRWDGPPMYLGADIQWLRVEISSRRGKWAR